MNPKMERMHHITSKLDSPQACTEALKRLGDEVVRINNARMALSRSGTRTLLPDEKRQDRDLLAHASLLQETRNEVRRIRQNFRVDDEIRYERHFMIAAKEMLGEKMYVMLTEKATERLNMDHARRALGSVTGSAISMTSNGGGFRLRKA